MEFLKWPFTPGYFMPHGHCYLWDRDLVWLHAISDSLIFLAYMNISIMLFISCTHERMCHSN